MQRLHEKSRLYRRLSCKIKAVKMEHVFSLHHKLYNTVGNVDQQQDNTLNAT